MGDNEGLAGFSGDSAVEYVDLSFAAFVFAHLGCPDAPLEIRIGEGLLLEWCSACEVLQTFGSLEE